MSVPGNPEPSEKPSNRRADSLLQCLSHSPLISYVAPPDNAEQRALEAIATLQSRLQSFRPEVIFLFAPDHYNGFLYDLMPQFCIGVQAESIGDYTSKAGPLDVPQAIAEACAEFVVEQGIDAAVSYRMLVDHGFAQPLEMLTGSLTRYPVVPIYVNGVAKPLCSMERAMRMGTAVGRYARTLGLRCAFIGSGGLSHSPPIPSIGNADPDTRERLIAGHNPTPEQRNARQQRVISEGKRAAEGQSTIRPPSPEWDQALLRMFQDKNWEGIAAMRNADVSAGGGNSAHETKAWVAACAAMHAATAGDYTFDYSFYESIPAWIAGFGAINAHSRPAS